MTNNKKLVKADFFKADKEFAPKVVDFVRCWLKRAEINKTFNTQINGLQALIDNAGNLVGSILEGDVEAKRAKYQEEIDALKEAKAEELAARAKFEFTDADKNLKRVLKNVPSSDSARIENAIIGWFKESAKLDITGTTLLADLVNVTNHKANTTLACAENGKKILAVDVNGTLSNIYARCYECMVEVGTIKEHQIPEVLMNDYKEKMAKKAEKAAKKANKKAKEIV